MLGGGLERWKVCVLVEKHLHGGLVLVISLHHPAQLGLAFVEGFAEGFGLVYLCTFRLVQGLLGSFVCILL